MQEVCSFLIIGTEKAVLFDTGMGISDISAFVKQLTDLEIMVLNSHTHFEDIGDDWSFPAIHVNKDDYALDILKRGFPHWDVRYDADMAAFFEMGITPATIYSCNMVIAPGLGTIDEDGELMEEPARLAVKALVRATEIVCKHAGLVS